MSLIIAKYIIKKILKTQIYIILSLSTIFFCQKLIQILEMAINGDIPINSILLLLTLEITEIIKIIFPFSLFLGIIITFNRMYHNNEIIAMRSCGVNNIFFIINSLIVGFITMILIMINVLWISPYSLYYQSIIISKIKSDPSNLIIAKGRFKFINNNKLVIFINKVNNKKIEQIFLTQSDPKSDICHHFIVIADYAYINSQSNNLQFICLNGGMYYNWSMLSKNFKITSFNQYKYKHSVNYLKSNLNYLKPKQMTINKLKNSLSLESNIELHWRITLILSVLIMSMLAISLSISSIENNTGILYIISVILLYLLFFIIQNLFYFNGMHKKINTISYLWITNIIYIFLIILINIWNTFFSKKIYFMIKNIFKKRC